MWWLLGVAGLFLMRGRIAAKVQPLLASSPERKRRTVLYGQLITLMSAVVYIVPFEFVGLGAVKKPAYMLSLWSTVLTSIFTIAVNYGAPPMPATFEWKTAWQTCQTTLQPWLQEAMMNCMDFHFLFFALIFLTASPMVWALLILGRHRFWAICKFCDKAENGVDNFLWRRFQPTWKTLEAKPREEEVLRCSALAEILLGIFLAVSLFMPSRQIITTLLYWNFLKTRYSVPRSKKYHDQAWMTLNQKAAPVFNAVPFLRKPFDMAKGWFQPQYTYRQG